MFLRSSLTDASSEEGVVENLADTFRLYWFPKPEVLSPWDIWLKKHMENCRDSFGRLDAGCGCIEKLHQLGKSGY